MNEGPWSNIVVNGMLFPSTEVQRFEVKAQEEGIKVGLTYYKRREGADKYMLMTCYRRIYPRPFFPVYCFEDPEQDTLEAINQHA